MASALCLYEGGWRNIALLSIAAVLLAAPACAGGWNLCNHTSYIVEAAVGRPGGDDSIQLRGWLRLRPGECRQASPAPLTQDYHYIFARSSSAHRGGQKFWDGMRKMCVRSEGAFARDFNESCDDAEMETVGFRRVRMDNPDKQTTRLREADDYSLKSARAAGLQRLINDAGVARMKISGHRGKVTRKHLRAFIKDKALPGRIADSALIDMLEGEANSNARNFGMDLCNRTGKRIWAAIGARRSGMWESRGWWPVDAQECARVIDASLPVEPFYIFAEMEENGEFRRLKGPSRDFCIAHSKFVIEGSERCAERFYDRARFVMTEKPSAGRLLIELFEDDFLPGQSG